MSLSLLGYFVEQIRARIHRLIWGEIAVQAETDAVLNYAAQLSRLEDQAVAYEAAGQPQLAIILRERASQLILENPGATAMRLQAAVAPGTLTGETSAPAMITGPATAKLSGPRSTTGKQRGRPRKPPESGNSLESTSPMSDDRQEA